MPVLSLPLPGFGFSAGLFESLPVRVPFPFMRIASILPHAINEPIKSSLLALFKLAWSAKVQLPVLITVCFMAFDIRLQLEINIFWETNNARQGLHEGNRNGGQRRASREEMRRIATAASGVYQQQRRRLIQEIRALQAREREQSARQSLPVQAQADPSNAPLATLEDSDIDDSVEGSESETITCSQRSIVSEAGWITTDEETDPGPPPNGREVRKRRRVKRVRVSTKQKQPNDNEEDEENDEDDDAEYSTTDDDDDDNDDDNVGGGGASSSHGRPGNEYGGDPYDPDSDSMDNSGDMRGGSYSSPLVVEVEIRHRASRFIQNNSSSSAIPNSYVFRQTISREFRKRFKTFHDYIFTYTPMYFRPSLK